MEEVNKKLNELYEKISKKSGLNNILTFKINQLKDFEIAIALLIVLSNNEECFNQGIIEEIYKEHNVFYDRNTSDEDFKIQLSLMCEDLNKKEEEVLLLILIVLIKEVERM